MPDLVFVFDMQDRCYAVAEHNLNRVAAQKQAKKLCSQGLIAATLPQEKQHSCVDADNCSDCQRIVETKYAAA